MRERRLRAEVCDGHGLFERERAGHDFAINRAQLLAGHRSGIRFANPLEDRAFAVWRVNFLAGFQFDTTDGEHVLRAAR